MHTFDRSGHRSNSVQATGFSPTLKIWSQEPPETVSEIENLKFPWGRMPPDPPILRKSMSSRIFIANEKTFEVLI